MIFNTKKRLKIIGSNIRNLRNKAGITIDELSLKCNIRKEYALKIEEGSAAKLSIEKVLKIADFLNVDICEILSGI